MRATVKTRFPFWSWVTLPTAVRLPASRAVVVERFLAAVLEVRRSRCLT